MARPRPTQKLTTFVWEGKDTRGRRVKGEHEAPSVAYVNATLRRQGIRPTKVKKQAKPLFSTKKRIKTSDIVFATRQMATMIGAGIPIAQAIQGIERGHENPSVAELLRNIRQEVEAGRNFSEALIKYPQYFDRLYTSLVAAGEQSGTLDDLLDKVATYKEKVEAIKSKVKSALFYPGAVLVVAVIVVSLLLIFVIPQFESLFENFGGQLPTLTQMMVDLSRWFQKAWWQLFGGLIIAATVISYFYKRSPKAQFLADRISLRIPILGEVLRKATIARFSRTLATMFSAGVPLVDSLESVAGATGNRVYYNAIMDIKNEISTGRSLEVAMASTNVFPSMVLQMVATGEESGELETMLNKVADFYEREVDDAVAAMSSLIEPVMIVVLGGIVGTVVVAMYLPIFKMAAVF